MEHDVAAQQRVVVRERRVEEADTYDEYLDSIEVQILMFYRENVMAWILILFAHTSVLSNNDSNSITTAVFATEQHCKAAGEAAKSMANFSTKVIKYTCAATGGK